MTSPVLEYQGKSTAPVFSWRVGRALAATGMSAAWAMYVLVFYSLEWRTGNLEVMTVYAALICSMLFSTTCAWAVRRATRADLVLACVALAGNIAVAVVVFRNPTPFFQPFIESPYGPKAFARELGNEYIDRVRGLTEDFKNEKGHFPTSQIELVRWIPTILPFLLEDDKLPVADTVDAVTAYVKGASDAELTRLLATDGKYIYLPRGLVLSTPLIAGDASPLILYARKCSPPGERSVATANKVSTIPENRLLAELSRLP